MTFHCFRQPAGIRRCVAGLCLHTALLAALAAATAARADILFVAKVMGPVANVYSVDETGKIKKLTDNTLWRDLAPDRAANGDIAFMSNREDNPKVDLHKQAEDFNIYTVDKQGGNLQQVTHTKGHDVGPEFSPDGRSIAYVTHGVESHTLSVAGRGKGESRVLAGAEGIVDLSWSPDGREIAYAQHDKTSSSLTIVNVKSGESRTLVKVSMEKAPEDAKDDPDAFQMQIASVNWSPDGGKIAYIRHPLKKAVRRLWILDTETGESRPVSPDNAQVQAPVNWSKDGGRVLYSALVDYKFYYDEEKYKKVYEGGMHIFVSTLDGKSRQITRGNVLHKAPVFSPDEKRIAFLYADALDARTLSLRTMKTDGTDVKKLYGSVTKASSLDWY